MGGAEPRYVQEAFESNWLSTSGPNLAKLEKQFSSIIGVPSVALVNGTAAIHLGLKLLGIQTGDEVVCPTLTFAASSNPILYEKARPVFLDSERRSWNLDPDRLTDFLKQRAAANRLPKAVVVVHLFGQGADLDAISEAASQYDIPLLEDAAEALGAKYKGRPLGKDGAIGTFSFNGNKVITSTGGGMLVSGNREWISKARYWSTQACDPDPEGNYAHSELGYNYRLSNVLAGIALGQLEVLEERVQQRRAVFARYRAGFAEVPGLEPQPEAAGCLHSRWLSCFLIREEDFGLSRAELVRFLNMANVEARPVWKPMHTQKLYQGYECIGGEVAEDLNRRGICLPSSSSLTQEDQQFVIDRIVEAHRLAIKRRSQVTVPRPVQPAPVVS